MGSSIGLVSFSSWDIHPLLQLPQKSRDSRLMICAFHAPLSLVATFTLWASRCWRTLRETFAPQLPEFHL